MTSPHPGGEPTPWLRPLGRTGLEVSAVGLGAGRIGDADLDVRAVDDLLAGALDLGVNLVDAARSYGESEERIGAALHGQPGRRDRFVLSTKLGYGVPGVPDWTGPAVTAGVDAALRRFGTDRLDVVHLHSCDRRTLEEAGVVEALEAAVVAGKVRAAAYSGEGEALAFAVRSGRFAVVQCSVSLVDQASLDGPVAEAAARGVGVLGKRPLGNSPWRWAAQPERPTRAIRPGRDDEAEALFRFTRLALLGGLDEQPDRFARFAAFAPGVAAILVGTAQLAHLAAAVASVRNGPLPAALLDEARRAWAREGQGWPGRV